jgi:hypothetical protein
VVKGGKIDEGIVEKPSAGVRRRARAAKKD